MNKKLRALILLTLISMLTGVIGVSAQDDNQVTFMSTQFNIIEEAEKFREMLSRWRVASPSLVKARITDRVARLSNSAPSVPSRATDGPELSPASSLSTFEASTSKPMVG